MTIIKQQIIHKLRLLSSEQQEEVLAFVNSPLEKDGPPTKLRSLEGLWEDLNIDLTEEEITQLRRECWCGK
jgi:hypothetical protein